MTYPFSLNLGNLLHQISNTFADSFRINFNKCFWSYIILQILTFTKEKKLELKMMDDCKALNFSTKVRDITHNKKTNSRKSH